MQAARGLIGLAVELAARVQGAQDHLQRGFVGELRMRIDRNAAAIVAHGQRAVGVQLDLDAVGMACHRLVHRVVDDLGGKVVIGALVNAADIHAGAQADRLQRLQHLDGRGVVGVGRAREKVVGHGVLDSCYAAFAGY